MRYFYSHLIEIESVLIELDSLELSEKERVHLSELIDESIHHTVLDEILSNLTEEDKKRFIECLKSGEDDKTLEFLQKRIENIEEKIKEAADQLKKRLREDIREVKNK